MSYNVTGTAGNDTLDRSADSGPGTIVGLAGTDCIFTGSGLATITGDAGADTIVLRAGNTGTIAGGGENDSISATVDTGAMMAFGNDGADTIFFFSASGSDTAPIRVLGGDSSTDGGDSIETAAGNDLIFGNGGADTLRDSHSGRAERAGSATHRVPAVVSAGMLEYGT